MTRYGAFPGRPVGPHAPDGIAARGVGRRFSLIIPKK